MLDVSALPELLADAALGTFRRLVDGMDEAQRSAFGTHLEDLVCNQQIANTFACSEFISNFVVAHPEWTLDFLAGRGYHEPFGEQQLKTLMAGDLAVHDDQDQLVAGLRRVRNLAQTWIIWRDFNARDFDETVAATTLLADRLIDFSVNQLHEWTADSMGRPIGAGGGEPQRLVVVALGKLGAEELNLSSDVDLMFAFPEAGSVAGSDKSNQAFFLRLGQRLIQVLDNVTGDGFVFRVDMRLRPYGDSGALVHNFGAIEQYYEQQGRGWERYALIRARICAGDATAGAHLLKLLQPFVYRRYVDFGALEALREMKERVDRERGARGMRQNIKLGPGGIREVEFVVQMLQLIWGGRHAELRRGRTLHALAALADLGLIGDRDREHLEAAYRFLRDSEHKLQGFRDQQTQTLPETPLDQARLAWLMGFVDYAGYLETLDVHRRHVSDAFEQLVTTDLTERVDAPWADLWTGPVAGFAGLLGDRGYRQPDVSAAALERLRSARDRDAVAREGRERLDALLPKLLEAALATDHADRAVQRVVPLLEAILRRSAYLVLLNENARALAILLEICADSRWMAGELARHPALLDDLLSPEGLFEVPSRESLAAELAERMAHCDDPETALEMLSSFKESHDFRCAACQLRGTLPLMNVSDYLTYLAEVLVEQALELAWRATASQRGEPADGARPFVIVGYGKLGGLELGPGSDLDLVFVHELDTAHTPFLHRMVRRLMHLLTARTHSGAMYEIDMRLRPDGRSGMMVSSLTGFEQYQRNDAWIWEQQALVRARPVAGDRDLAARFVALRHTLLRLPRDQGELRESIVDMRNRIEQTAEHDADLKRQRGGIVDIEFMVQYLVLAWASAHPELCVFTDNVRILETATGVGLLTREQCGVLTGAYLALRAERHRSALDIADDDRARALLEQHREGVQEIWEHLFQA